MSTKAEEKC